MLKPLSELTQKITDYVASGSFASLKENVRIYKEPNYALLVKTADFSNNFTKDLTYTDRHGYEFLSNSNLFGGELILSNIGSIGKAFIVPYLNMRMTLASNSIMVKPNDKHLSKYFYYFFLSPTGQERLESISSGTSMRKFNKTDLKTVLVPDVSLEEQQLIVDYLDSVVNAIAVKKKQIECLDELIVSKFNKQFCDKDIYGHKLLSEVSTKITDGSHNPPKGVQKSKFIMASSQNVFDDLDLTNVRYLTKEDFDAENKRTDVQDGDVLFTIVGTIGRTHVINHEKLVFQRSVAVIKPIKTIINSTYLKYYLSSDIAKEQIERAAHGVAQMGIYLSDLKKLDIIVPPLEEQNLFEMFVNQTKEFKATIKKQIISLEELFGKKLEEYYGDH